MIKPVAIIVAALVLAGCDNTGTGGYQLDAYALNGTSTAIAAIATSTAVSGNQTRQAAEYVANVNGTATAVQVTATAAAIGTAKAQITNAEAIAILERAQIENAIAWDGATATAVHNQLLTNQATARAARAEQTAVWWVWVRWVLLGILALSALFFIPKLSQVIYYRWMPEDTAVYDKDGNPRAFHHSYRALPATTIIQPQLPRTAPAKPQTIMAERDKGYSRNDTAMPAPNSVERQNINAWLIAVNQGMSAFNRTGADTYRIGHVYADTLIDLAVRTGYAAKEGEHRTAPVIPRDNFEDFINQFISNSPYSAMPMQENASPG